MHDTPTENFQSNPDIAISYMMAMYRAAERTLQQQSPVHGNDGKKRSMSQNLVEESHKSFENTTSMRMKRRSPLSPVRGFVSHNAPKLLRDFHFSTSNSSADIDVQRVETTHKRKMDIECFPLDLSVKKVRKRRLSGQSGCDANKQPALNSKTSAIQNQLTSFLQPSNPESLVVTDCVDTKPCDHVFMKFKLDKLDLGSNNKQSFIQGKYKNYLATKHKQSRDSKPLINAIPNRNKPINDQRSRSRDSTEPVVTSRSYEKRPYLNLHGHKLNHSTDQTRTEMRNDQFMWLRGPVKNEPKDRISHQITRKDQTHGREKDRLATGNNLFHKNDVPANSSRWKDVNSAAASDRHREASARFGVLAGNNRKASHNAETNKKLIGSKRVMNNALERLLQHIRPSPRSAIDSIPKTPPTPNTGFLADLGDWNGIEMGRYPAFGKGPQLKPRTQRPSRPLDYEGTRWDENYLSENTMKILHNATASNKTTKPDTTSPELLSLPTTNVIHRCPGCTDCAKRVPKVISEIWRFKTTNRYTAPSKSNSSNVTYCGQLQPKPTPKCRASSLTSTVNDVTRKNDQKDRIATTTNGRILPAEIKESRTNRFNLDAGRVDTMRVDTESKKDHNNNKSYDDDLLANLIEYSSDEDEDQPIRNNHTETKDRVKSSLQSKSQRRYKEFIESIVENNPHRPVEPTPKLLSVCSLDTEKDEFRLSDLEISDDEDEHSR